MDANTTRGLGGKLESLDWINPVGGMGDALMLSGVLKLVHDTQPAIRYNCVRRTQYAHILRDHPAIRRFGFPPADARIIVTEYWSAEKLGAGPQRAFQVLARMFGLPTPVEERLYIAPDSEQEEDVTALVPWGKKNVIIAPSSDAPRKMLPPKTWERVVSILRGAGISLFQAGRTNDHLIRGAYSLLGLTTPRQLIRMLGKADMVITVDNFVMHAAHLAGAFALVLWGPTDPDVYGYAEQAHLRGTHDRCEQKDQCLGPGLAGNYPTGCPRGEDYCMAALTDGNIVDIAGKHLYI